MASKEEVVLQSKITCHAWNGDRTMVAISVGSSIHIYKVNGEDYEQWEKLHELDDHDHTVTCIDWAPKTNRIISCSQDRNAYVWTFDAAANEWKPVLVLLRINRAATTCKWSPSETKFAVGSASKLVSVCYFEQENNWWIGKMIKKPHKSTVLGVAWHPTDETLLVTSSSDFKTRVFSAYIKAADPKPASKPPAFGEVVAEYSGKGWCHAVEYSPKGTTLAFVGHDSTITVVDQQTKTETCIRTPDLPYRCLKFLSENCIIAAGYSFYPVAICKKGDSWVYVGNVDVEGKKKAVAAVGVRSAFNKFQTQAAVGSQNAEKKEEGVKTRHHNLITSLQIYQSKGEAVQKFSTSGLDGRVLIWDVASIAEAKKEAGFTL